MTTGEEIRLVRKYTGMSFELLAEKVRRATQEITGIESILCKDTLMRCVNGRRIQQSTIATWEIFKRANPEIVLKVLYGAKLDEEEAARRAVRGVLQ